MLITIFIPVLSNNCERIGNILIKQLIKHNHTHKNTH